MNAFDTTLNQIVATAEPTELKRLVMQLLTMGAVNQAARVKALLASILQKKFETEIKMAAGNPQASQMVDKKYQDLSEILRMTPVTGPAVSLEPQPLPPPPQLAPHPLPSQAVQPTPPSTQLASNSKLPAKVTSFSGWDLLSTWFQAKKPYILSAGVAGTVVSAALYAYNKFYKKNSDSPKTNLPALSPEQLHDKEAKDFERTLGVFKQIQMFNHISKNSDLSQEDYNNFIKKPSKAFKPQEAKKLEYKKKQATWDTAANSFLKNIGEVSKGLGAFKPKRDAFKLPPLEQTIITPYGQSSESGSEKKAVRVHAKKRVKKNKETTAPIELVPNDVLETKPVESKKKEKVAVTVPATEPVELPKKTKIDTSKLESLQTKLVPVVKLTKRIKRITGD